MAEPLTITRNGRDRLVLLSVEEYERLKRRDRRVVRLEDFTDEEMALIAKADVPAEHHVVAPVDSPPYFPMFCSAVTIWP